MTSSEFFRTATLSSIDLPEVNNENTVTETVCFSPMRLICGRNACAAIKSAASFCAFAIFSATFCSTSAASCSRSSSCSFDSFSFCSTASYFSVSCSTRILSSFAAFFRCINSFSTFWIFSEFSFSHSVVNSSLQRFSNSEFCWIMRLSISSSISVAER